MLLPVNAPWKSWLQGVKRDWGPLDARTGAAQEGGGPCNCCPTCECGGWWSASGDVLDPAAVVVTRTQARIGWTSTFSRPEWNECDMDTWTIENWPADCDGFQPTALGTNWYRAACVYDATHWPMSDRFGYTQTRGLYYNDDFILSFGQRVWVDHTVYVWVNGSKNGAGEWHEFSGFPTYYFLRAGVVSSGGSNWCTM